MTKKLIDVNASVGNWPFMNFPQRAPAGFSSAMEKEGIGISCVSATESILFPDPDIYDKKLFAKLKGSKSLIPVKTINPSLENWQESLETAVSEWGARIVKIYPNYHQYSLVNQQVVFMAAELEKRGIPLMIQMRVDDERNQYPLMKVPGVSWSEITILAANHPELQFIVLCSFKHEAVPMASHHKNIAVDISFIETGNTLRQITSEIPPEQVLFGSHTPFLYTKSAVMKVSCSDIEDRQKSLVSRENAIRILNLK